MTSPLRTALDLAAARLEDIQPSLPVDRVVAGYARTTGISLAALTGPSKAPAITGYRHELMYLIRRLDPAASFSLIGRFLGGRDMSTVHEAIAKVDQRVQREPDYAWELAALARQIVALAGTPDEPAAGPQARPWQLLAACSVLRDGQMTDAEARRAALAFLRQLEVAHG